MNRIVAFAFAVLCLTPITHAAPTISAQVTDSGLHYSLIQMPDKSNVNIQIAWPTNWAFEANNNLAAPYIGARLLLAGGSQQYPAGQIIPQLSKMEARAHLVPTPRYIFGAFNYAKAHQDDVIQIINAHLRAPALDQTWFKRLREQLYAHIKELRQMPETQSAEAVRWAVLGAHPLRAYLSLDEPDIMRSISREDIQKWVHSVIKRQGAQIVIAGSIEAPEASAVIDKLFDGLSEGQEQAPIAVETDLSVKRILMHTPSAKTSSVAFFGPMPPINEGSEFEDMLLMNALNHDKQNVLFKELYENLNNDDEFHALIDEFSRDRRQLVLKGTLQSHNIAQAEKILRKSYAKLLDSDPIADLPAQTSPIMGHLKNSLNDLGNSAYSALMAEIDGQGAQRALTLQDELAAVSTQSLRRRLHEAFPAPETLSIFVTSPDADALPGACVITQPAQAAEC